MTPRRIALAVPLALLGCSDGGTAAGDSAVNGTGGGDAGGPGDLVADVPGPDADAPSSDANPTDQTPARLTLDPSTADYSSVTVLTSSPERTFTVANAGQTLASIPTISIAEPVAGNFTISRNSCVSALAPGEKCLVGVRFTPDGLGSKTGLLQARSAPGATITTTLTGTGIPLPATYRAILIVDRGMDRATCGTTNGPGADIDAVELRTAAGVLVGVGKIGTVSYAPGLPVTGGGAPCEDDTCMGADCKYADPAFQSRSEGVRDAVVKTVGDDTGYFSLNNGRLQIQFGDEKGFGTAKPFSAGMQVRVWEVDQTYIKEARAPASCACAPEQYEVFALTAPGSSVGAVSLYPGEMDPLNSGNCAGKPGSSGCGSTIFTVP